MMGNAIGINQIAHLNNNYFAWVDRGNGTFFTLIYELMIHT
jgi:hypothetical protein